MGIGITKSYKWSKVKYKGRAIAAKYLYIIKHKVMKNLSKAILLAVGIMVAMLCVTVVL